ncbi:DMT family transporter [Butyricicoccus sp. 1XD8-22]|nr:DMT family transporter [Butyricicoccus sp. 1XD8-22]
MQLNRQLRGHLFAGFTILIWGTTFISTKVLLRAFSPAEILLIRFALGYLALWAFNPRVLRLHERKHELWCAVAGLCGITIYYSFENIALQYSTASNIGVIVSVAPLFTAIFAAFFLKGEQLKPNFFAGFAAAIVGVFLMNYTGGGVHINPKGDMLALLAAVAWGVYSILVRRLSEAGYPPALLTRRFFLWGLVFMSPYVIRSGFAPSLAALTQPVNLLNLAHLSFLAGAVGFVSWNTAVSYLGAVKSSVYIYATPVVTIITAALVLGERLTPVGAVGVLLVILGVVLSDGHYPRLHRRKEQHDVG